MKILKIMGGFLAVIGIVIVGLVSYLTVREYRPTDVEVLIPTNGTQRFSLEQPFSVTTFNIGYGALGEEADFFMDGGKNVQPDNKELIEQNLAGIQTLLKENPSDIYLLQEIDRNSIRSYSINQEAYLQDALQLKSVFAYNFNVDFVPYPWPPIGRVKSGIATYTNYLMSNAKRIALPNSFSWPVRTSNLKRALLETRFPIENSDKELVLVNLHLEAYDDGQGKIAQTKMLMDILSKEYQKGNYVVAGGDFNQLFEGAQSFPQVSHKVWEPGEMKQEDLPEGLSFAIDDRFPTVRSLDSPFTGDYQTSKVYVIDGFIVSDNVAIHQVQVIDQEFKYSDHQPIKLEFNLKKE